jgi:hypothetical protein
MAFRNRLNYLTVRGDQEGLFNNRILNRITSGCWWLVVVNDGMSVINYK